MDRPWYADDEFWATVEPFVFTDQHIENAPAAVDALLALSDVAEQAHIGDVPCGVGRHSVELATRGHPVTAVDSTPQFLGQAREKAADAGVAGRIEFVEADMRTFERERAFDLLVNCYTSFGYFEDRTDDERTVRNWYRSLVDGGRLVMSLASKETLASTFQPRGWREHDGVYLLEERSVDQQWSWIENRWIVVDDGTVTPFSFGHRLYAASELTALLEGVGFEISGVYGSLDGDPYDHTAEQLVVVAEK